MRPVFVAIVVAALLAGCGGDGGGSASGQSLEKTSSCLEANGATVSTDAADLDYVAQDAGAGALTATFDDNEVTVAFERSESDAGNTEAAYRIFAEAFEQSTDETLERYGTAVALWDKSPTEAERSALEDCL